MSEILINNSCQNYQLNLFEDIYYGYCGLDLASNLELAQAHLNANSNNFEFFDIALSPEATQTFESMAIYQNYYSQNIKSIEQLSLIVNTTLANKVIGFANLDSKNFMIQALEDITRACLKNSGSNNFYAFLAISKKHESPPDWHLDDKQCELEKIRCIYHEQSYLFTRKGPTTL